MPKPRAFLNIKIKLTSLAVGPVHKRKETTMR
jgi:hypothetical protein